MPSTETLLIFLAAAMLLNISPGPSNFYVMSHSMAQGRTAGYIASLGLGLGGLVHVFAAALGLSALFAYSPTAYSILKLVGAAYLIFLGIRLFIEKVNDQNISASAERKTYQRIFWESALVEITNPKTALFFIAFLPQFVDVSAGPPAPQLLLLGLIVTLSALPCDLFVAYGTERVTRWMSSKFEFQKIQSRVSGSILLGLGVYVLVDDRRG